jgi:hypothetical protein
METNAFGAAASQFETGSPVVDDAMPAEVPMDVAALASASVKSTCEPIVAFAGQRPTAN